MGQDERYWRDPREFLPERWENRKDINPFSYIPFGVGPRMCIGRRLAEAEMQLITAQLCRSYRLHLVQEPECMLVSPFVIYLFTDSTGYLAISYSVLVLV